MSFRDDRRRDLEKFWFWGAALVVACVTLIAAFFGFAGPNSLTSWGWGMACIALVSGVGFWCLTLIRRRDREIEAMMHRVEETTRANQIKSDFLANMSHELRTPMTAILGYTEIMSESADKDVRNHAKIIERNGRHLLGLINDILDISKIESGKMVVEEIAFSPHRAIADVASLMRVRAQEKNIGFEVIFPTGLPDTIHSDPTRIRQVLMNLLGNAIKFTTYGYVKLEVSTVPSETAPSGHQDLVMRVIDTGIGIPEHKFASLFEPFSQADLSTTRRFGGTGLGLTISKKLCVALGGDLKVESSVGKGSVFIARVGAGDLKNVRINTSIREVGNAIIVTEENEKVPVASVARKSGGNLVGKRILLAEDGPDNQKLISFHLRKMGAEVEIAGNGRIACEKIHSGGSFDLILMDMQMPEMDGYEATRALRGQGCSLPIIALTAHAMKGDREKCINYGCDDYLSKPFDKKVFAETLSRQIRQQEEEDEKRALVEKDEHEPVEIVPLLTANHAPLGEQDWIYSDYADDEEMLPLIEAFVNKLPRMLQDMRRAQEEGDQQTVFTITHQLKGAGGGYGFGDITNSAAEATEALRSGQSLGEVEGLLQDLESVCARVRASANGEVSSPARLS